MNAEAVLMYTDTPEIPPLTVVGRLRVSEPVPVTHGVAPVQLIRADWPVGALLLARVM